MVSLIPEQTFFPVYLFYSLQRMGFIFRPDHDDVLGIIASLVVSLTDFCPMIIGKGPAETVDPGSGMSSVDIIRHNWKPHFLL
jgi:hypothetical protein